MRLRRVGGHAAIRRCLWTPIASKALGRSSKAKPSNSGATCPASLVAAITGVAGPEPDEDGNPVGLVFVTVVARDCRQRVEKLELGNQSKGDICRAAVQAALRILEELLTAHVP